MARDDDLSGWGSDEEAALPIERRLDRIGWRVDSLDRWRKQIERRLGACEDGIENVTKSQEIAKAVAAELAKRGSPPAERVAEAVHERGTRLSLTWYQKAGGAVMGAIVVMDAIRGLIS